MAHPFHSTGEPRRLFGSNTRGTPACSKVRRLGWLILLGAVALPACGGPQERAGGDQDKAEAAAQGDPYSGSGPNERIGEVQDRAAAAEQNVRDADAEALRARGENLQRQADIDAARLDEKSRSIREAADKSAEDLDEQAEAARRGETIPATQESKETR